MLIFPAALVTCNGSFHGYSGSSDVPNVHGVQSNIVVDTGGVGRFTSVESNGLNIYVSYYDFTNGYLKFARSTDNGMTW